MNRLPPRPHPGARGRQRGVATLVIVLLLLLTVALAVAYTSRGLLFDQRSSVNFLTAAQAQAAAEAGVDWALALLNGGRVDGQCSATAAAPGDPTFRQRYLDIAPADGHISVRTGAGGVALTPGCVLDNGAATPAWRCECPAAAPALQPPPGLETAPAFRLRFVRDLQRPTLVWLEVNGCTRLDPACLAFPSQAVAGAARATVRVLLAPRSALPTPPAAALTAGGAVDLGGAPATLVNRSTAAAPWTLHAGGPVGPVTIAGLLLRGPAGTPAADTYIASDPGLQRPALPPVLPTAADRLFAGFFGLTPAQYREQPAVVRLGCRPVVCDGAALRDAVARNPGRMVWADGDLVIDGAADVASPGEPLLLVVDGHFGFASGATLHGLVYVRGAAWAAAAGGRVEGAVIAEGDVQGSGLPVVVRNDEVLARLRLVQGSFVRVPGSWKDFE
jgi:hypothetical protein